MKKVKSINYPKCFELLDGEYHGSYKQLSVQPEFLFQVTNLINNEVFFVSAANSYSAVTKVISLVTITNRWFDLNTLTTHGKYTSTLKFVNNPQNELVGHFRITNITKIPTVITMVINAKS
jgi:hypothetical protein